MKQGTVVLGLVLALVALGFFLKYQRDNMSVIDKAIDSGGDTLGEVSEWFDDVANVISGWF